MPSNENKAFPPLWLIKPDQQPPTTDNLIELFAKIKQSYLTAHSNSNQSSKVKIKVKYDN